MKSAASALRELVDLTGVRGYTSWDDEERGCEVVSLETHEALVSDYMALGRAADALLDQLVPQASAGSRLMGVACSQWASCGWRGRRLVERLGVQPRPCPRCGKEVVA